MDYLTSDIVFVFILPQLLFWAIALTCYVYRRYRPVDVIQSKKIAKTMTSPPLRCHPFASTAKVATPKFTPFGTAVPEKYRRVSSFSPFVDCTPKAYGGEPSPKADDLCSALEEILAMSTTLYSSPTCNTPKCLSFTAKDDLDLEMSQKKSKKLKLTLEDLLPVEYPSTLELSPQLSPLASPPLSASQALEQRWKSVGRGVFAKFGSLDSVV
ncbi:uncharacterized protein LOC122260176 [Penaeus japonicus]|uniref:uncharacterized protein LOC122260176 n=1 Tax=Penaeus japonicus TaxID=27405 RepID=UPI001C70F7C5|nr:uncharacterized protein LOC122260176 [Penaeus japonicus]